MPYDTYQIERGKSPAEVRLADEHAARLAAAVSSRLVASRGQCAPCGRCTRPERAACPLGLTGWPGWQQSQSPSATLLLA